MRRPYIEQSPEPACPSPSDENRLDIGYSIMLLCLLGLMAPGAPAA